MRIALFTALALVAVPAFAPAQSFTITMDPIVIPYDPATGIGSATTSVFIVQDLAPGETADPVAGFSFSYSHDPTIVNTADINSAPALQALNGGVGPGLGTQDPDVDGGVVAAVFDLFGQETIAFGTPIAVIELTFATVSANWIGNTTGGTTSLSAMNPASQNPPVLDIAVIQGSTEDSPMTWILPEIQFVPTGQFIRGDADGDGSVIVIGDAITVLGGLFSGETIPCLAGADINGDGAVDVADPITLLNFGFLGGAPPPAPFPDCGSDPESSALACADSAC